MRHRRFANLSHEWAQGRSLVRQQELLVVAAASRDCDSDRARLEIDR